MARKVVTAELRMETPMKEMAERTRFTRGEAEWVNWGGGEREMDGWREGGSEKRVERGEVGERREV